MDIWLFDHLSNTISLKFQAYRYAPIGLGPGHTNIFNSPLPFKPNSMSTLEELELHNIFIGPELLAFLEQHKRIRILVLKNAFAGSRYTWSPHNVSWQQFFDRLVTFKLNLDKFILEVRACFSIWEQWPEYPESALYWWYHSSDWTQTSQQLRPRVERIRAALKLDPHRPLFPYAFSQNGHSRHQQDYAQNCQSFELGEDQAAYDRFMESLKHS